jgi:inhibitor of cysteine peptidase
MELDEKTNGTEVSVPAGESLVIRLAENPTTGFRWTLVQTGEPVCVPIDDVFVPDGRQPGGGGWHRWNFQAATAGSCRIELASRRSWEQKPEPAQVYTVQVRVRRPA